MTLMEAVIYKATPLVCKLEDGRTIERPNNFEGIPFVEGLATPDNCTPGQTMAEQISDAVFGPGSFRDTVGTFNKTLATFWTTIAPPEVATDKGPAGAVSFLQGSLVWYTMAVMIGAVAIRGARIAWDSRNGAGHLDKLTHDTVRWFWVLTGATIVAGLFLVGGHEYSVWIIDKAAGETDFAQNLTDLIVTPSEVQGLAIVAQYALLGIAVLAQLVQIFLMFVRNGALVVALGTWPLSASAGALASKDQTYDRFTGLIVALLLYEPAAATIYAGGIALIGTPTDGGDPTVNAVVSICSGIALFVASIFVLFWLIKITSPSTDALSESGGSRNVGMTAGGAAALSRR